MSMGRARGSTDGAIQPADSLLQVGQCFLGLIFQQEDNGDGGLFQGSGFAVGLEAVPVNRCDRKMLC